MGILDAMFGGGSLLQVNPNAASHPFMERLTSGLGQEGGLLQRMGMGQHGNEPIDNHFGRPGGLLELLRNSTSQGGGTGQQPGQAPQTGGLAELIASMISQNRRG
ncbi:hypothetical protein FJ973_29635 [Mesorhizobium sp. B2-1-3]|uniref:hypothetical protein n=1 Tax=Mesorhizobium sp. B2-1-3 TaxID=2589972 RepID=UPI00112B8A6F|nr:hypothetical protein [Mesorhizobium sp. B2-1-3]TPN03807.1 hypothetical protein FJ973_29635 [Mesorhizobium sp. B2-1-3]